MKAITEQDLLLLYYGEHEDADLAARVAESAELSARFEALSAELACLDQFEPPRRGEDYGAEMWQKISPQLAGHAGKPAPARDWLSRLLQPRFSLAGATALVLVAVLAFTLGRQGTNSGLPETMSPALAVNGELNHARFLTTTVAVHLEQLNVELTQFANMDSGHTLNGERATELLVANRLYRQAASARGEDRLANFLAGLEPLLVELAYEAYKNSPQTQLRLQNEIRENLLFRVRLMNQQLGQSGIST